MTDRCPPAAASWRTPRSSRWPASEQSGRGDSALLRRLVYVAFFIEVGLLLIVLPWSSFWERNYFGYALPVLRPFLTNEYVRGAISGLGVLNLFAGFSELAPLFAPRDRHDAVL